MKTFVAKSLSLLPRNTLLVEVSMSCFNLTISIFARSNASCTVLLLRIDLWTKNTEAETCNSYEYGAQATTFHFLARWCIQSRPRLKLQSNNLLQYTSGVTQNFVKWLEHLSIFPLAYIDQEFPAY